MNPIEPNTTSEKQRTANRANAKKSTGPKTLEGKQKSSRNARQHGFTASTFAVIRLEDLDEVARLRADLIHDYEPQNSQELFVIERLALAQQTLLRLARLEAGLFTAAFDTALNSEAPLMLENADMIGGIEITRAQNRNHAIAAGFDQMNQKSNSWTLLMRYQAQADRQYRRLLDDLTRLQSQREILPNEPNLTADEPQPIETKPLEELFGLPDPNDEFNMKQINRNADGKIYSYSLSTVARKDLKDLPMGNL